MSHYDALIVGGGHGGAQAAIALRQRGFTGSIAIVGDEAEPPYERPPLSKDYLAGDKPFERILIRPADFWTARDIALLGGRRIVTVDADAHRLTDAADDTIGYGSLVWATGGTPRSLACSGHALPGVHAIRTRADVDRLSHELADARRVVVIGAGYIGLEAASALVKRGLEVTVVEAQSRVLARVAGPALSAFFADVHRAAGVTLLLDAAVECLEEDAGRVGAVRLAGGELLPADIVIVGIGIVPAVEPLTAAGAVVSDGVEVDGLCRTSLPDIFAIGDCARHANRYADGAAIRLESVQNAADMATTVAGVLTGSAQPYEAVPWFWSNQYDLKLQTVGLSRGHDEEIVRGDPATRRFSTIYRRDGRVIAFDCVNMVRDYVQGRALVMAGARVDTAALADPDIPLKELLP